METSQGKLDLGLENHKTLQDFRNELQEMSFNELYRMNRTGETAQSNLINSLLRKLDDQYGTEYQPTKSVKQVTEDDK